MGLAGICNYVPRKRPRILSKEPKRGVPTPDTVIANDPAPSQGPSARGQSGGAGNSAMFNDFPERNLGKPPRKTTGGPSMSSDVNASEIMQNMVMNDDDKEWYAKLFKKQAKNFLKPRFTVQHGFNVGLNASRLIPGRVIREDGIDHRLSSYGIFIPVPPSIVRQIELLYPPVSQLATIDDSPPHVTVLYIGELNDCQAQLVRTVCAEVIKGFEPFEIGICGTGHFLNSDSSVFHARVIADRLTELHHVLRSALETAGIPIKHTYGECGNTYQGHVTLAYLPPGQMEPDIDMVGSWVVDRIEVWNMGSPVSLKLGSQPCLGCSVGMCRMHVTEGKKKKDELLLEPEDQNPRRKPKKKEFSSAGGGNIRGQTGPMGSGYVDKRSKKRAMTLNARSFGGGKTA